MLVKRNEGVVGSMLVERKEGIVGRCWSSAKKESWVDAGRVQRRNRGAPFKRIMSCIDFKAWSAEFGRAFWWWEAELLDFTLHGALPRTAT